MKAGTNRINKIDMKLKDIKIGNQVFTAKMQLLSAVILFIMGVGIGASVASKSNIPIIVSWIISVVLILKYFKDDK